MKPGDIAVLTTFVTTVNGLLNEGTKVVVNEPNAYGDPKLVSIYYQRPTQRHDWHSHLCLKTDLKLTGKSTGGLSLRDLQLGW